MLDSLKYAKQLEGVGFSREQAEAHLSIMSEIITTHLATREDVTDFKMFVTHRFDQVDRDFDLLRREFREFKVELKSEVKELVDQRILLSEHRMTIRLGTIVSIAIGVAVSLTQLLAS
jgi:hypothetical protein